MRNLLQWSARSEREPRAQNPLYRRTESAGRLAGWALTDAPASTPRSCAASWPRSSRSGQDLDGRHRSRPTGGTTAPTASGPSSRCASRRPTATSPGVREGAPLAAGAGATAAAARARAGRAREPEPGVSRARGRCAAGSTARPRDRRRHRPASASSPLDLAGFLVASARRWTPTGGPVAGEHSFYRGADPRGVRRGDPPLPGDRRGQSRRPRRLGRGRLALASTGTGPGVWFHGDVAAGNLLVRDGRLSAVIDFGTCGVGDPACDLVIAWTFLDAPGASGLPARGRPRRGHLGARPRLGAAGRRCSGLSRRPAAPR